MFLKSARGQLVLLQGEAGVAATTLAAAHADVDRVTSERDAAVERGARLDASLEALRGSLESTTRALDGSQTALSETRAQLAAAQQVRSQRGGAGGFHVRFSGPYSLA